ncbi:MAG: PAS domain-containing protein, partial [Gammaproteobacteria bacterium]|nr:PAS domain-containing protein [Gammaproteobacteria bacterium]
PNNSGLAFVVIQHLSPDYKSLMVELLSKSTEMPVCRAKSGMTIEKNHVYLIPPKHDLTVFHGKIILIEQKRESGIINLPIDIFFKSLAEDQRSRAIAIVLSGTGSDGMRGIKSIKENGGMVMVQDALSAKFDGMPRSVISTGLADFILSTEEMPDKLINFIKHPYSSPKDSSRLLLSDEDGLTRIFYLIREKCKVDFTFYKPSTFLRRLERRMAVNQVSDLEDYVQMLEQYPAEVNSLFRELLISVTQFFRDREAFEQLGNKWLPKLFEKKSNDEIRIWIPGCATGEEAYTFAIVCREVMDKLNLSKDVKIFATDVDQNALQRASTGTYPESIMADLQPELVNKYFFSRDDGFQIARTIREMVVFAKQDLLKDPPFTNIDLVSCRNLLIYFQPVLQKKAMEMFNFSLNPEGILFLGSSETTGELSHFFKVLDPKEKIYASKGKRHTPLGSEQLEKYANHPVSRSSTKYEFSRFQNNVTDDKVLERFLESITNKYIPLTLVVNEMLEILHVFGETSQYFALPSGKMENNLVKMSRKELSIPLATGVQKAFKSNEELRYSNIRLSGDSGSEIINLHVLPLTEKHNQTPLVSVFIEHVQTKEEVTNLSSESTNFDVGKEAEQRILDLEQELQFTRENLQATVEELETSNEELQATNEELLASNEELQSTNEELQSVNEELYTVNAEHQSKIIELTELNNDLDNLLVSTDIATVFLDEALEVRKYTPQIKNFFKILESDIGRPISHILNELGNIDLLDKINRVKSTNKLFEMEVQINNGQWYQMRILPYHIAPQVFLGVVITFLSIHKIKQMQEELINNTKRCVLAQKKANFGVWEWDMQTDELFWSEAIAPLFGLEENEFDQTLDGFMKRVHPDDLIHVKTQLDEAIRNNTDYIAEHRIIMPDGTIRWMSEFGHIETDDNGNGNRMIGVVRDINDTKKAELTLKHSEYIFRTTLENLDMIAIQLDVDANIVFANDFFLNFVDYERDEILGKNWISLFIPEDFKVEVRELYHSFIESKADLPLHFENSILCKNGKQHLLWWNNTAITDEYGVPIGVSAIGEDISLREKLKKDNH